MKNNNLFKSIFLLVNLISTTVSSVNNSSLPLAGTNLTGLQNVSELVKRDEPISVYGGMKFLGLAIMKKGGMCETPCTFSFPVSNGNKKGFLTSYNCAINTVFSTNGVEIGSVQSHKFETKSGLNYAFVVIKDKYWSDEISSKIDHYQCATSTSGRIYEIEEPLLIIPAPNPLLSVGDTIYVHGGDSDTVHGKILATDVKVRLSVPGTCGRSWVNDFKAIKMEMNKDFELSFIGAPVYLPLQVPGSTQRIASPVGQVVTGRGPSSTRPGYDPNKIWYYIPLDPILKDSGLKLVVGNFSSFLPPNSNNKDLNDVLFTDNLAAELNTSESKNISNHLDKRQIWWARPGGEIWVSSHQTDWRDDAQRCTLGFPVRREGRQPFNYGYLIFGNCLSTNLINNRNAIFNSNIEGRRIRIGFADTTELVYISYFGLNFGVVKLITDEHGRSRFWNDEISAEIIIPANDFPPYGFTYARILDQAYFPPVGTRVCATAGYSNQLCGTVTDLYERRMDMNSWLWVSIVRQVLLNVSPQEVWLNLIKVRLDRAPRAYNDDVIKFDWGSPVYYIEREENNNRVRPVGIIYGYTVEEDVCTEEPIYYMLCVSVDRILTNYRYYRLIPTPQQH